MADETLEELQAIAIGRAEDSPRAATSDLRTLQNTSAQRQQQRPQPPQVRPRTTATQKAIGAGELGLTMLTGAIAEPVAGVQGLLEGITSYVSGEEDPAAQASERVQDIQEFFTYQPRTPGGQEAIEAISRPVQGLSELEDIVGRTAQDAAGGSPAAGAAAETAVAFLPGLFTVNPRRLREGVSAYQRGADIERRTGADLNAKPEQMGRDIVRSADEQVGGRTSFGENFEAIQQVVTDARARARKMVDELYARARNSGDNASVSAGDVVAFRGALSDTLEGFDIELMPNASKRMEELMAIDDLPIDDPVKINMLENWRRRVSQNPGTTDAEKLANSLMKGEYDQFINGMFNSDMISGDPAAVRRWANARAGNAAFARTFKDEKVIRQLAEQEATSVEVRNWILGASQVAKPQAQAVVQRLRRIMGEDSPEFQSIRQEVAMLVMEPLLKEEPNIKTFRRRYENIMRRNRPLMNDLFGDQYTDMRALYDLTRGIEGVSSPQFKIKLSQAMAQGLFGHEIAQGSLRQSIARNVIEMIRSTGSPRRSRQIIMQITGVDPATSVFQRTPIAAVGASEGLQRVEPESAAIEE